MIRILFEGYQVDLEGENLRILEEKYEFWKSSCGINPQTFLYPALDSEPVPTVTFEAFVVGYMFALFENDLIGKSEKASNY